MNRARRDTLGCTRCEGDWAAILTWRHMVPNCATTLTNYPPSEEQADPMNFVYDDIPLTLFFEAPSGYSSTASSSYPWPKMHSRLEEEEQLRRCWQLLQKKRRPSSKSLHGWGWGLKPSAGQCWWSQGGIYRVVFLTGPPYKWLSARPLGNLTIRTFFMGLTISSDTSSFFRADQ